MAMWTMGNKPTDDRTPWRFCVGYYDRADETPHEYYLVESYAGHIFSAGEMNGYDDSDFYGVVWSTTKNDISRINYATTRAWTYPNSCTPDAIPEIIEARRKREALDRALNAYEHTRKTYANPAIVGRKVKVTKGRKVPVGTEGEVTWAGRDKFAPSGVRYGVELEPVYRVGVKTASGEVHFTAGKNCTVIMDDDMLNDLEMLADAAFQAHLAATWAFAVAKDALEAFEAAHIEEWRTKGLPAALEDEQRKRAEIPVKVAEMAAARAAEAARVAAAKASESMKPETPTVQ